MAPVGDTCGSEPAGDTPGGSDRGRGEFVGGSGVLEGGWSGLAGTTVTAWQFATEHRWVASLERRTRMGCWGSSAPGRRAARLGCTRAEVPAVGRGQPVASRCVVGVAVVQGVSSLRPQAQPSLDGSVAMKYGWGANGGCGNAIVNRQARENRTLQEIDGIWPVPYYPSLEKTGAVLVCPTKQGVTRTARTDASSPTRG